MDAATIKSRVITKIKSIAEAWDRDGSSITEATRFYEDLGFQKVFRQLLAKPLGKISNEYGGDRISQKEAGKLKTVDAAIKLVMKKIGIEEG